MNETDKSRFVDKLMDCAEVFNVELTSQRIEMYWSAFKKMPIDDFEGAVNAHMLDPDRGRFFPRPADIVAQIQNADDGRPEADEAWSISLDAADEAATVVWTEEMAEAWGAAQGVFSIGDEVGARMAFKSAYERAVRRSRNALRPVTWSISLGHDKDLRESVLVKAVEMGRLEQSQIQRYLPAPIQEGGITDIARLLTGKTVRPDKERIGKLRKILADTEDRLERKRQAEANERLQAKQDFDAHKSEEIEKLRKRIGDEG